MADYAIVENGVAVNVIVADADFAEEIGAILLPEGFGMGDLYDGMWSKALVPPAPPEPVVYPPLTARRFWLAADAIGVSEESAVAAVQALTTLSDDDKRRTIIELRKATEFDRLHPAVLDLTAALGIPAEQVDTLWLWAATL